MDWKRHYTTRPLTIGRTEYLAQVGHTVAGKPIPEEHFQWIVSRIRGLLDLGPTDVLLDLCCGNGLVTRELAAEAKHVVGIDFSEPLLEIANEDHRPANVTYQLCNALDLAPTQCGASQKFDKVCMYAALQHFRRTDLGIILDNILQVSTDKRVILLGFVPDRRRRWSFYDSPKRKLAHLIDKVSGSDRLGTWWDKEYIRKVCEEKGLSCSFHDLDSRLHASKYRFDVRITYSAVTEAESAHLREGT